MQKHFHVFGEPVEVVLSGEQTHGQLSVLRQTCGPGSGPPPHMHTEEDEVFSVVAGRFELLVNGTWTEVPSDGMLYAPRNHVHTFRNCGDAEGVIQIIATGDRFERFLQGLSGFTMPQDIQAVVDYSVSYGISYPTLPPPSKASANVSEHDVQLSAS